MIPSSFHKRPGTTLAGVFSVALASVLLLCGAGSVPIENFMPQGAMQADLNAGNHSITNAATVSGTNVIANSLASTATVNGTNLISNTVGTNKLNFSALPPNGAAAGDLSGSYPNPTVAKINGVTPSGFTAGTTNVAIGGTFPNQAVSVSTAPPAGPAGGDLSGTYPNPTVAKINGATPATVATSGSYNDLSNKPTIPAAQVNSDWNASSGVAQILNKPTIPTALPPNGAAGGDLSGTYPNPTVAKINGVTPSGLVAGANVTISGTFPNQTIAASSGSSSANVTGFRYSAGAGSTDTAATQAQALTLTGIGSIAAGDLVEGQGASAPIGIVPGSGVLSALTNNTDAPSGLVVFNGTSQYPAGSGGLISGLSIPYLNGIGSGVASAMQQTTNGTNGLVVLNGSGNLIALNGANLTSLNASNISSGNLAVSRLSSGTGASSTTFWRGDGTWATPSGGGGSGTVASVGFTGDGTIFNASVTGSPVTTSGTFAPTLANAAQNSVLAGPPSGGAGAPGYQTAPTFSATNLTGVGNSPTALSLTSSSGATTLTRMAAITNLRIFLGAGSYLQQFPLSLTGAQNGDVMNVVLSFPASTGMTAQFYNGTTGGTALLPSPSGTNGVAAYMHTLHFNFDGTAWNLQNDGAVLTKTLGSGEAAALAIAPNTPGGHATISSFSPSGITSLTAKPLLISVGFDRGNGSSQGQMYAMLSTDGGVTWRSRLMNYVDPAPYPVNNIRDVNLWLNKDGTPYRNARRAATLLLTPRGILGPAAILVL